jgi:hypothetical protein
MRSTIFGVAWQITARFDFVGIESRAFDLKEALEAQEIMVPLWMIRCTLVCVVCVVCV